MRVVVCISENLCVDTVEGSEGREAAVTEQKLDVAMGEREFLLNFKEAHVCSIGGEGGLAGGKGVSAKSAIL